MSDLFAVDDYVTIGGCACDGGVYCTGIDECQAVNILCRCIVGVTVENKLTAKLFCTECNGQQISFYAIQITMGYEAFDTLYLNNLFTLKVAIIAVALDRHKPLVKEQVTKAHTTIAKEENIVAFKGDGF